MYIFVFNLNIKLQKVKMNVLPLHILYSLIMKVVKFCTFCLFNVPVKENALLSYNTTMHHVM